jgi:hypothetical protein
VIRGDKVVLGGDVTVKDSQIEIDLPEEAKRRQPRQTGQLPPKES